MNEANFKSLVEHMPLEYFDLQDIVDNSMVEEDPITKMFTDPKTLYVGAFSDFYKKNKEKKIIPEEIKIEICAHASLEDDEKLHQYLQGIIGESTLKYGAVYTFTDLGFNGYNWVLTASYSKVDKQ